MCFVTRSTVPVMFFALLVAAASARGQAVSFDIELSVARKGFDRDYCWVHARAGAIPPGQAGSGANSPLVVMTTQKLLLSGSDVFYPLNEMRSVDLGRSWTSPVEQPVFARQVFRGTIPSLPTGASIAPHLLQPGDETTVCDFTPKWHAATGKLLGVGHTVWYRDNRVMHVRPRGSAYSIYDPARNAWLPWEVLRMPDDPRFENAGAGSVQRFDLDNGDILLPIYCKASHESRHSVTVCRCRFDGQTLQYAEHGSLLTVDVKRGLYEPSITRFGNRFFLTMRNDDHGYVASGPDGLQFGEPRKWTFDDGSDLGNYNTQQHWVTHRDGLFLVYTRRGMNNDHVFRHRAPLLIARVDPEALHVIRDTERILVPQRGARLGNFGVCEVSPEETWVTAAEWMQPNGVEKYGSDNSIFIAKIRWHVPNRP
ncbi:MAG: exo-alpha-sialidase [Patescibacteria group bacterium]|nr:exo-alpha-sialidase [Patescibacteria group bacterium]